MNWKTISALFMVACTWSAGAQTGGNKAGAEPVDLSASAVVASRGGADVDFLDIDARVARIPVATRPGYMDNPERIESLIHSLLLSEQLANEARALHLDQDPVVQRELQLAANDVLARLRMERLARDIKLPDLSLLAEEKYLTNKAQYAVDGTLTVLHILVATKERSEDEAYKIAEQVLAEAKSGTEFKDLVAKYSDDPSHVNNGGMIQDAGSAQYDPAFAAASRELKTKGELSAKPVKSAFGYHVLKLLENQPGKQKSFADVKATIVEELRTSFIEQYRRDHTDKLRNMSLEADPDRVASLRTRYMEGGQGAAVLQSAVVPASKAEKN